MNMFYCLLCFLADKQKKQHFLEKFNLEQDKKNLIEILNLFPEKIIVFEDPNKDTTKDQKAKIVYINENMEKFKEEFSYYRLD
mmetsp:Transcript_16838/g.16091  ORF Transcript_16838/g.16091 Transcript_16838/m.16091 type:complete len:83 (-) Transcript_16838:609-857(-)